MKDAELILPVLRQMRGFQKRLPTPPQRGKGYAFQTQTKFKPKLRSPFDPPECGSDDIERWSRDGEYFASHTYHSLISAMMI